MKLLIVSNSAAPEQVNGLSTQIESIVNNLDSDIYIFSSVSNITKDEKIIKEGNVTRHFINTGSTSLHDHKGNFLVTSYNNPKTESKFKKVLKEQKPDIIHFHSMKSMGVNLINLAKKISPKTPLLVTMHDYWWISTWEFMVKPNGYPFKEKVVDKKLEKILTYYWQDYLTKHSGLTPEEFIDQRDSFIRRALKKVDKIICVSENFKNDIVANIGFEDKTVTLPNAINKPLLDYNKIVKHKNFGKKLSFVFLGGNNDIKGYGAIIGAVRELIARYPNQFTIKIFNHPDGTKATWFNVLRNIRRKFKLREVEYYPGFSYDDIDEVVYKDADVLLNPSIAKESYGLVSREALIRGVPVIASKAGGLLDDLVDGENSILIPWEQNNDSELTNGLIKAMSKLIEDRDLLRKLSTKALDTKLLTSKERTQELKKIYEGLLR